MREELFCNEPFFVTTSPTTTQETIIGLIQSFKAAGAQIVSVPCTHRNGCLDAPRFLDKLDKLEAASAKTRNYCD